MHVNMASKVSESGWKKMKRSWSNMEKKIIEEFSKDELAILKLLGIMQGIIELSLCKDKGKSTFISHFTLYLFVSIFFLQIV